MAGEVRAVEADIPMGMTQVEDGEHKVLFIRDEHGLRAFQAKCPHYGAPLAKGEICGQTLYCPWHKAAFDIGDGALVQPPALKGLDQYPIRTEGEKVVATLEPMAKAGAAAHAHDDRLFVIVGTGAAAVAAATTLRDEGFGGRLVMVGREPGQPYDRPKLSKNFLAKKTEASAMLLETDFFASVDADFMGAAAETIDVVTRKVTLADGQVLEPDALLIATGSRAVVPPFPGRDLGNVFTLRSLDDAEAISAAAETAKTLVVIGGGFIGLEAAAFLTKRGLAATVVSPEALPLSARMGDDIAHALKVHHEGTGIRFLQGKVARIEGSGPVSHVRLESGDTLPADIVLIGTGAAPETDAIVGVPKREDGGIAVGPDLTCAPGVWLAGDVAAFPEPRGGGTARIEHWRLAQQHGMHAARGMLGHRESFHDAPFFWSNQGDKRLDYAGYTSDWDEIVTRGEPAKLDFISYFIKDGKALAACAIGQNPQMIAFLHLLDEGRMPEADSLAGSDLMTVAAE